MLEIEKFFPGYVLFPPLTLIFVLSITPLLCLSLAFLPIAPTIEMGF